MIYSQFEVYPWTTPHAENTNTAVYHKFIFWNTRNM
jgi:hypothetical protein